MRTFTLGAGADVVKFTSASYADANTIKNFGTTDKLSFLSTQFAITGWTTSSSFTPTFKNNNNIEGNKVYFGAAITDEAVAGLEKSAVAKALAITQTGGIYYIDDDNSATLTPILVGSVNIDTLEAGNIEFVAS